MGLSFKRDELSSIVEALGDTVKLMHFVEKYNRELELKQNDVEDFFAGLDEMETDEEIDDALKTSLKLLFKALKATVRAKNSRIRYRIKNLINLIEKHKNVNPMIKSKLASKKLLLLFKSMYLYQLDEHIRLTMFYEDSLVFGDIRKMTSEAASVYEKTLAGVMSSDAMTNQAKKMATKIEETSKTSVDTFDEDEDEFP